MVRTSITLPAFVVVPALAAAVAGCGGGSAAAQNDAGAKGSAPPDASASTVDAPADGAAPDDVSSKMDFDAKGDSGANGDSQADGALGADGDSAASCGSLPMGTSAGSDAGDVSYSWTAAKTACFGEPFCQASCSSTFLQNLVDCNAVEGGYFWNFGSVYIRVAGRRGGSCVYDIGSELEGAVTYKECTAPMPVAPWPGLRYVNSNGSPNIFDGLDGCTLMQSCSVQAGFPMPCDEGPAAVPTCPSDPSGC
jgi:hypothetical protein